MADGISLSLIVYYRSRSVYVEVTNSFSMCWAGAWLGREEGETALLARVTFIEVRRISG